MLYVILSVVLVIADQLTKALTVKNIPFEESINVISGILSFTYIKNSGAAWGIFSGGRYFFIIFTALVLIALTFVIIKKRTANKIFNLAISLIYAGAIGNFLDRIFRHGNVVDMIKLDFIGCGTVKRCIRRRRRKQRDKNGKPDGCKIHEGFPRSVLCCVKTEGKKDETATGRVFLPSDCSFGVFTRS